MVCKGGGLDIEGLAPRAGARRAVMDSKGGVAIVRSVGAVGFQKVVETGMSAGFEVKHVPSSVGLSYTSPALHTLAMSQVPRRLRDSSIRRRGAFGVLTGCNR